MNQFKLCILFGDSPDLDPAQIAPGWEMAEIPVALVVRPFDSEAIGMLSALPSKAGACLLSKPPATSSNIGA